MGKLQKKEIEQYLSDKWDWICKTYNIEPSYAKKTYIKVNTPHVLRNLKEDPNYLETAIKKFNQVKSNFPA